jgi:hypothetical protein
VEISCFPLHLSPIAHRLSPITFFALTPEKEFRVERLGFGVPTSYSKLQTLDAAAPKVLSFGFRALGYNLKHQTSNIKPALPFGLWAGL